MRYGQPVADVDLKRTLQSLACGKQKVLKKKPVGPDIKESDTFYFNDDYTSLRYQVKIDSIQAKETVRAAVGFGIPFESTDKSMPGSSARGKQTYGSLYRGRPETRARCSNRPDNEGEEEISLRTNQI